MGPNASERRKYPRFYPSAENKPKVILHLDDGQQFSVDLINISRGGMLASTPEMDYFLEMNHQKIKIVEIIPPMRKPFRCAGKILRIQPVVKHRTCYFAVEFKKLDARKITEVKPEREHSQQNRQLRQWLEQIWNRVLEAENYLKRLNEPQAQQKVYTSFDDITQYLSLEDRWWFYELLDEIKRMQPDIPEKLKEDFFALCAETYTQSQFKGKSNKMDIISDDADGQND